MAVIRSGCDPAAVVQDAEQEMLGADVVMTQQPGFLLSEVDGPPTPDSSPVNGPTSFVLV
jgi:hypothetical protein